MIFKQKTNNKYHNEKVVVDGIRFDSIKEAKRYRELNLLVRAGEISDLELQKEFVLIPNQYINGKLTERAVKYKADFVYKDKGNTVVEDTKGLKTDVYKLKKKLMLYVHGIRIQEI